MRPRANAYRIGLGTALVLCGLTGCYEDEMKIKHWAQNESANYFRTMIRKDVEARVSKALAASVPEFVADSAEVRGKFTALVHDHLAAVQSAPKPPVTDLDQAVQRHHIWSEEYLTRAPQISELQDALTAKKAKLRDLYHLCDDYLEHYSTPPIDIASIAAISGGGEFSVYLSLSFGLGDGAANQPTLNYDRNQGFVNWAVNTFINHPIENLLSSEEERNAREDAEKIIHENYPQDKERKELTQGECKRVTQGAFAAAHAFEVQVDVMQAALLRLADRLYAEPIESMRELNTLLASRYEGQLAELARQRAQAESQYRRGDQAVTYLADIRHQIARERTALLAHDCPTALRGADEAERATALLKSYVNTDDDEGYRRSLAYFDQQNVAIRAQMARIGGCDRE